MKVIGVLVLLTVIAGFPFCFGEHCLVIPHPICVATSKGDVETVKRLLHKDPKLIEQGQNGYDLLTLAAILGQKEIAKLAISNGANVNAKSAYGSAPLHSVAVGGHKDMAEFLLDNGADIDQVDRKGRSSLHLAVSVGQLEMATFLKNKGANVDVFSAAALGDIKTVRDFLDNHTGSIADRSSLGTVSYGSQEYGSMTLLEFAIIGGSREVTELLLRKGADVNAVAPVPVPVYATPLHEAAQFGRTEVAELLMARGARIDATNYQGDMPIHFAARYGKRAVVEKLIERGVDVNVRGYEAMTPLHYAAMFDHQDIVEFLLTHKADINATAAYYRTPLHAARGQGREKMVEFLRQHDGHE